MRRHLAFDCFDLLQEIAALSLNAYVHFWDAKHFVQVRMSRVTIHCPLVLWSIQTVTIHSTME